ncbi:MAG TPA: class I SAM-dependent methyltransferase [Anaerolineae bacterium]
MTETHKLYGGAFNARDLNNPRTIIAQWVPLGANVLEVGPGDGVISRWLRENRGCHTTGVEIEPVATFHAADAFEQILIGSIEDPVITSQVAVHGPFDAIIFADVLEHLVDPWKVLREMRPLLSPVGRVLISVPNIAHWTARMNLLLGRFDYTEGYLMDRTHLRWFTRRTAREMALQTGYLVMAQSTVYKPHIARFWPTLMGFQTVLNLAPSTARK